MNASRAMQPEAARSTPVLASVDVLVAGGGPAGIAAAIAAAREGASTMLVERYGYLGGMVTGGGVIWILGMGDGHRQIARGICQDIRERLEPVGGISDPNRCGDYTVDPEALKWQAAEMVQEAGASLLLHATICDPIVEDGRMRGFFIESKSGRQAIRAKVVVDCTADADLAFRAGCPCDNDTHDVTLMLRLDGVDRARAAAFAKEQPEAYAAIIAEAKALNGGVMVDQSRHLKLIDITDVTALTRAETVLRHDVYAALGVLRCRLVGWENARIRETQHQLGVRQSRRIRGVASLSDADLRASRHFDDGIARLGSYLLGYRLYEPAGLAYDIPYGCLLPTGCDDLLVAGRCISCDYEADNSLRLIVPCFATGQAAGAAAALAVRLGVTPRRLDPAILREALRRQRVCLDDAGMPAPAADGTAALQINDGGS